MGIFSKSIWNIFTHVWQSGDKNVRYRLHLNKCGLFISCFFFHCYKYMGKDKVVTQILSPGMFSLYVYLFWSQTQNYNVKKPEQQKLERKHVSSTFHSHLDPNCKWKDAEYWNQNICTLMAQCLKLVVTNTEKKVRR